MKTRAAVLILFASVSSMAFATNQPSIQASWQQHELKFPHIGFTNTYSCKTLRQKYRQLLEHFGARNVNIKTPGCDAERRFVDDSIQLQLSFETLVTNNENTASAVPGYWQEVEIKRNNPLEMSKSDCEIIDRFRKKLLPLFSHTVLSQDTACRPNEARKRMPNLKALILKDVQS